MDQLLGLDVQKPMFVTSSGKTDTMWELIVESVGAVGISGPGWWYMASVPTPKFVCRGPEGRSGAGKARRRCASGRQPSEEGQRSQRREGPASVHGLRGQDTKRKTSSIEAWIAEFITSNPRLFRRSR